MIETNAQSAELPRGEVPPDTSARQFWDRAMGAIARYHHCEVIGSENVPKTGGVVVVGPHSLATYDLFVLCHASLKILGRQTYIVGDDLMFKLPLLGKALAEIGFIKGGREYAIQRLQQGDLLGIAPGGMAEALHQSEGKRLDWSRRKGFTWVAMKAGVPVVPTACPNADDIFTVYGNPVTDWIYKKFKLPLPVFRGVGPTPIPRPVKLVHLIGKPVYPEASPDRFTDDDVTRFHDRIVAATQELVDEGRRIGVDAGPNVDWLY